MDVHLLVSYIGLKKKGWTTSDALLSLVRLTDQLVQQAGRTPIRYQEVWVRRIRLSRTWLSRI